MKPCRGGHRSSMRERRSVQRWVWVVVLAWVAGCEGLSGGTWREAGPHPELGPEDVVAAQLEALRQNDAANTGIEVAFRFASPANRHTTGPLERFVGMIQEGPYELLLGFDGAHAQPVEVRGSGARQRVTVIRDGRVGVYLFVLSRQSGGTCSGCWMTDAVLVEEEGGETKAI